MSVNITVAVPLDTVRAIQTAAAASDKNSAAAQAAAAIVTAVESLPYKIEPKTENKPAAEAPSLELQFQPEDKAFAAGQDGFPFNLHLKPQPSEDATKDVEYSGRIFPISVKMLTGKVINFRVSNLTTAQQLRCMIQDREQMPPDLQLLIYKGQLVGGRPEEIGEELHSMPLGAYGISDDAIIHLLLTLRGS